MSEGEAREKAVSSYVMNTVADMRESWLFEPADRPVRWCSAGQFVSGPGWRHARRTLDSAELIVVSEGVLPLRLQHCDVHVGPGEFVVLPAGYEHAGIGDIDGELSFYWMHWLSREGVVSGEPRTADECEGRVALPLFGRVRRMERLAVLWSQLLDACACQGEGARWRCDYAAMSVLLELSMQVVDAACAQEGDMRAVREWIRANALEDLSVAAVARRWHYSPSYLTARYRRAFGMGIIEQIVADRMETACSLLVSTSLPVSQVARESGYGDPRYFSRVFRRRLGVSPSQYRGAFPMRLYNSL